MGNVHYIQKAVTQSTPSILMSCQPLHVVVEIFEYFIHMFDQLDEDDVDSCIGAPSNLFSQYRATPIAHTAHRELTEGAFGLWVMLNFNRRIDQPLFLSSLSGLSGVVVADPRYLNELINKQYVYKPDYGTELALMETLT